MRQKPLTVSIMGKLFAKLLERGVPSYIIRILQFWYSHQTMQVRWGMSISTPFYVSNGELVFPSFSLAGEPLVVVKKVKYLGHVIIDDLCDDDDVQRQCGILYGQANMLARKFYMCTTDVKISLFKAYCTPMYTAHLWCNYSKAKMKKLHVAYNDALRILLKTPRGGSASEMFVTNNVPTFNAVLRNVMYRFMGRLTGSMNTIIVSLIDISQSDTRFSSCFWKHWTRSLYVF